MTTISMPKRLTTATIDRAAGVLLGQAVGDALGVPYEFGTPPPYLVNLTRYCAPESPESVDLSVGRVTFSS